MKSFESSVKETVIADIVTDNPKLTLAAEWWFYNECKKRRDVIEGYGLPTASKAMYISLGMFTLATMLYLRAGWSASWNGVGKRGSRVSVYRKLQREMLQNH